MKYIIDLDALKECLDLLSRHNIVKNGQTDVCVVLCDVKNMIDRFPKEKFNEEALKDEQQN